MTNYSFNTHPTPFVFLHYRTIFKLAHRFYSLGLKQQVRDAIVCNSYLVMNKWVKWSSKLILYLWNNVCVDIFAHIFLTCIPDNYHFSGHDH